MRFVDLFCGIGGFHAALHRLGHECIFATDIDAHAAEVYEMNWGQPGGFPVHSDVRIYWNFIPSMCFPSISCIRCFQYVYQLANNLIQVVRKILQVKDKQFVHLLQLNHD